MIPLLSALAVLLLAALAEWLHARRIRAVARLAFGPSGVPHRWTSVVPLLRPLCLAAFAWGLATLLLLKIGAAEGSGGKDGGSKEATRLVFVADLSPSMYLQDAGPDGKQTRQARMREVVEGILQRVSGNLRFGVIGFYTESMPVVMEARDPELVRNVFNGLPLTYAMPLGQTDLGQAINAAVKLVSDFPEGSTRLIIFTDGDSVNLVPIASRPKSVKEVFVLGLGNPHKGIFIDGHQSRQEVDTLRLVATALMGTYADVNEKHLPTTALGDLVVTAPPPQRGLSLAELAVLAMTVGAAVYALIPVGLEFFGSDWKVGLAERENVKAERAREGVLIAR
ncbi:MAG: Ca-activated chloride channel [Chthoniobacter sp.]|jgi:Ca-activated chloride channel family protein|nr:Ca-activated chloride channel [Chthoniobacter sp.]